VLPQEDLRAQFYEHYRKEAEEYDREFMKKYDEGLNTTLMFVGYTRYSRACMLTWVSGRSVLCHHFRLHHPGPTDETTVLLRVMLYKMDDTTFGGDIPFLPRWTGAPRGIIHVQAMLYTSLATLLFPAFLAMLGKQWLNRCVGWHARDWDRTQPGSPTEAG